MGITPGLKVVGLKKAQRRSKAAPKRVASQIEIAMKKAVELVRGRAQFNITGARATNPPQKLGRVSGRLAGSIVGRVETEGNEVVGLVGTKVIYARIHEFGGTIRAKRAPFLVFKLADGTFRRVKSVTIPARPYLQPAIKWARPRIAQLLRRGLSIGLRGQRAG